MSITIRKGKYVNDFTTVPNSTFQRSDLSWKAKGLLIYLLTLPDDWEITKQDLSNRSTDGYDSTDSAFRELQEKGYIVEDGEKRKSGKFSGKNYLVFPEPNFTVRENPERFTDGQFTVTVNPEQQNIHISNTPYSRITNEQKKQSLISNEKSGDFSFEAENIQDEIFQPLEGSNPLKAKPKKEKKAAHPAFKPIVKYFCEEYWPDYQFFGARDGKAVNEIIKQIERLLTKHGDTPDKDRVVEFFKLVIQNLPSFFQKKKLPIINSSFSEIVEQIKSIRNGEYSKGNSAYDEARRFVDSL